MIGASLWVGVCGGGQWGFGIQDLPTQGNQ